MSKSIIIVTPNREDVLEKHGIKPSVSSDSDSQSYSNFQNSMGDGLSSIGGNDLDKQIQQLKNRLYYINHKTALNKKRKFYKRQSWNERKDNPKLHKQKQEILSQ